ncbi:MAG: HD domain-containing protein [Treponema sp.]|nr:HD domain-containing protein [Treponema sp.]MBQ7165387.1 HD domain-containing protein [Treponema sp.]
MFLISQTMIAFGILLQVYNLYRAIRLLSYHKLLTHGIKERLLDYVVLCLIILFVIVYVIIFTLQILSFWIGLILFSGAIFVTVVLAWIYRLVDSEKENCLALSKSLISVIEARDPNLNGHSIHVQELAMLLHSYLPLSMRKQLNRDSLSYAALFHDVGKLGIPEAILNKPGKLTDEEWITMRRHPDIALKILEPVNFFAGMLDWIQYHHERIDGNGYHKMKGDEIPLGARLIAVADTYSAITMTRSYKSSRSYEEAMEIIKGAADSQLDGELVSIFCSIPKEEVTACMEAATKREF